MTAGPAAIIVAAQHSPAAQSARRDNQSDHPATGMPISTAPVGNCWRPHPFGRSCSRAFHYQTILRPLGHPIVDTFGLPTSLRYGTAFPPANIPSGSRTPAFRSCKQVSPTELTAIRLSAGTRPPATPDPRSPGDGGLKLSLADGPAHRPDADAASRTVRG